MCSPRVQAAWVRLAADERQARSPGRADQEQACGKSRGIGESLSVSLRQCRHEGGCGA